MKILLVCNKVKTYALGFKNEIEPLIELGHEVVWAADFSGFQGDTSVIPCSIRQINITSNPLSPSNIGAYKELNKILKEGSYDVVQCGTPIGGALARMAARKNRISHVIYEAHGFLFFKGAPLINRTLYKWQEFLMSRWTDTLITINDEDYSSAQKMKLKPGGKLFMIHGAGVEIGQNHCIESSKIRSELNLTENDFLMISAGILNKNKNNHVVIKAMSKLRNNRLHYLICGEGPEGERLKKMVQKHGLENNVHFLGFRTDVISLMKSSDLFVMPSYREGVPRSLLEAMDLGLPCIGSRTRGITELIGPGGGILCDPKSEKEYAEAIEKIMSNPNITEDMARINRLEAPKYSKEIVRSEYKAIYQEVLQ